MEAPQASSEISTQACGPAGAGPGPGPREAARKLSRYLNRWPLPLTCDGTVGRWSGAAHTWVQPFSSLRLKMTCFFLPPQSFKIHMKVHLLRHQTTAATQLLLQLQQHFSLKYPGNFHFTLGEGKVQTDPTVDGEKKEPFLLLTYETFAKKKKKKGNVCEQKNRQKTKRS